MARPVRAIRRAVAPFFEHEQLAATISARGQLVGVHQPALAIVGESPEMREQLGHYVTTFGSENAATIASFSNVFSPSPRANTTRTLIFLDGSRPPGTRFQSGAVSA